jgi:hypothetical protein
VKGGGLSKGSATEHGLAVLRHRIHGQLDGFIVLPTPGRTGWCRDCACLARKAEERIASSSGECSAKRQRRDGGSDLSSDSSGFPKCTEFRGQGEGEVLLALDGGSAVGGPSASEGCQGSSPGTLFLQAFNTGSTYDVEDGIRCFRDCGYVQRTLTRASRWVAQFPPFLPLLPLLLPLPLPPAPPPLTWARGRLSPGTPMPSSAQTRPKRVYV